VRVSGTTVSLRRGAFGRLLRARWFPFAAGGLAVALLATTAVVASGKFGASAATQASTQFAPTAFPTSLKLTSLPVISRGETSHVQLQSLDRATISTVQLYDNGQLYLTVKKPSGHKTPEGIDTTVNLDFAPLVAGIHVLSARVIDTRGQASLPSPLQLPVLDEAAAGGADGRLASYGATTPNASFVSVRTAAGETLKSLAARMGTTPAKVFFPIIGGVKPLGTTTYGLTTPLPVGILADAGLVSPQSFAKLGGYHAPNVVPVTGPTIIATVKGCTVTVTVSVSSPTLSLYASTPLQPGFVRMGDVAPNQPFKADGLPIGPSTFEAYDANATSADTSGDNAPTSPTSVTVPDTCATTGWSGDARIINGILLTDSPITTPYAYVSVDAGNWQRVPGDQSQSLTTGTINDIRQFITLGKYDQLDVQVWSFDGSSAFMQASGEFCRSTLKNADPSDSSGSTSKCRPPGVSPGGALTDTSKDEVFLHESLVGQSDTDATPVNDPVVTESLHLDSDTPVKLLVSTVGDFADEVQLQFSYFPISPETTAPEPPGVFFTSSQLLTGGQLSLQFHPWMWRNSKVPSLAAGAFDAGGNNLSLNDQIAEALAKANLAAGKDVVNTIYIRAVTIESQEDKNHGDYSVPAIASRSVQVDMKDSATYASIATATATLIPGDDEHATDQATRGECFTVVTLPPPFTWIELPNYGPFQINSGDSAEQNIVGNSYYSDREIAIREWGGAGTTHCLDPNADQKRKDAAQAAADAQQQDCGFWCFVEAAVVGAAVGFALGGPIGALAGAAAGISLTITDPGGVANLEAGLAQVWDLIADAYNEIYGAILQVVGELNPVCAAISASSSKDAAACSAITEDIVASAVTYFTGLPRELPSSSVIGGVVQGQLQSVIQGAIEAGASLVGVDCDDLTMSKEDGDDLTSAADKAGATGASSALAEARTPDGDYSLCQGVAAVVTNTISSHFTQFDSQIMGEAMESNIPPGMTVVPLEDTAPTLAIAGLGEATVIGGTVCPAYVNMTVHLPGAFTYNPATKQSDEGPDETWTLAPQEFNLVVDPTGHSWNGTLQLPLIPALYSYSDNVLSAKLTKPSDPYLSLAVDSPCLASTLSIVAAKYSDGTAAPAAFVDDNRPFTYYY
jgi:hypothetical protein